jgi:ribosomal protein S18 acetylase RimI-like enzyme
VTIEIRRAQAADVGAFARLHGEVQELHVAARPDQFYAAEPPALEARFRELFGSRDAKIWVAELDGGVVGYVVALHQRRPAFTAMPAREWCEIDQIAVAATHRRRGVATALMQAVVDDAHLSGLPNIELNSWSFNQDAHEAFRAFGFVAKAFRFELKK